MYFTCIHTTSQIAAHHHAKPEGLLVGTTKELWPTSKTKSLEMRSKLGIPVSVTSNPDAEKLVLNMDIQACSGRT